MALGQLADALRLGVVDAHGHEGREVGAVGAEHAEGAVAGADQLDGGLGQPSQHDRQVEVRPERHDGVDQPSEILGA
ncbi:MAG: hypothetical protein R2711_13240 [Acidimicrobiales bacterium]